MFFGPVGGYFALHVVYFLSAALFLGLLVNAYLGLAPAAVAMAAMMSTPVYYDAFRWDYVDGPEITYLLATFYFALAPRSGRRRRLYPVLAGFFAVAALVTQFYSAFFLLGLAVMAVVMHARRPVTDLLHPLVREAKAWAVGAAVLLVSLGVVAVVYGGSFLFFMPQLRALTWVSPGQYKDLTYRWSTEPRILAAPLALLLGVLLLRRAGRLDTDRGLRFCLAACGFTTLVYGMLAGWEFLSAGTPFELPDRFSVTVICTSFSLAVVVYLLRIPHRVRLPVTLAAMVAAVLPIYLLYGFRHPSMTTSLFMMITLALAAALTLAALAVRFMPEGAWRTALAAAVAVAAAFTVNFALTASHEPHKWYTLPDARPTYSIAIALMSYLDKQHVDTTKRIFWFDAASPGHQWIQSVQSIYYYDWTTVGHHMPRVDSELRQRLAFYKPRQVVLLCATAGCGRAEGALRHHGYVFRESASQVLASGNRRLWVRILDMSGA